MVYYVSQYVSPLSRVASRTHLQKLVCTPRVPQLVVCLFGSRPRHRPRLNCYHNCGTGAVLGYCRLVCLLFALDVADRPRSNMLDLIFFLIQMAAVSTHFSLHDEQ